MIKRLILPLFLLCQIPLSCTNNGTRPGDQYRSIYHFTPAECWGNDPNGMVYKDGTYHLFFQANPYGDQWGNMSWGHAVSPDLFHWKQMDYVLYPDSLGAIFSGSCVVDSDNTSGFGKNAIVAIYTSASDDRQAQSIAYSLDDGLSFVKYEGNPVIDENLKDFRDPKVIRYKDKWIMTIAAGQEVRFYSSLNLIDWTFESSFGTGWGCHSGVWECPDLFNCDGYWCLIVNVNPGGPFGGSATQYFIGSFNGNTFAPIGRRSAKWLDYGKDHYAAVTWSNAPQGRVIDLAWMDNWQYAHALPTNGWRGYYTIPRELHVVNTSCEPVLVSHPVEEILSLRKDKRTYGPFIVHNNEDYNITDFQTGNDGAYEMIIEFDSIMSDFAGFMLFNPEGNYVNFQINLIENKLSIDRSHSGLVDFNENFPAITEVSIAIGDHYSLRLFVDVSSIECFCDGEAVMTNLIFPESPLSRIHFYSHGGDCSVGKIEVYKLSL